MSSLSIYIYSSIVLPRFVTELSTQAYLLEGRGSSSQSFHSHSHATFRFPFPFSHQSLLLYSYRTISQMTSIDEYDANATMPEDDPNGNTNAAPGPNRWGKSHAGAQELQKMYGESK